MKNLYVIPTLSDAKGIDSNDGDVIVAVDSGVARLSELNVEFKNVVELSRQLEKYGGFKNVFVKGLILTYSSELNIRTLFSSFIGMAKSNFTYEDDSSILASRSILLSRVFKAIGVFPTVKPMEGATRLVFACEQNYGWREFEMDLIQREVNSNMLTTDEFIDVLEDNISNNKPFSFLRLNHCENRLIGYGYSFSQEEAEITYGIQFGYSINERGTQEISDGIREAVRSSNAIGVPTISPISSNRLNLLERSTYSHLSLLEAYRGKKFTAVNIHYDLARSQRFKSVLRSVERIHLITSRDISALQTTLNRAFSVMPIPCEYIFSSQKELSAHYPDIFNEIKDRIKREVQPGSLVLIGAGILGKIYCNEVKNAGGVAVDLGSFFDAAAKVNTRGTGFPTDFWFN